MARMQWNGDATVLEGPLLTKAELREWISRHGAIALRRAAGSLPLPFLFGGMRARRRLLAELDDVLERDGGLRARLTTLLRQVPDAVADTGATIVSSQLLALVRLEAARRAVAVPREAVVRRLARRTLASLGAAPILAPYEGLLPHLVLTLAREAERAFLDSVRGSLPAATGRRDVMIAAIEAESGWGGASPPGHYWLAGTSVSTLDLGRPVDRMRFAAASEPSLMRARREVAALEMAERVSIRKRLEELADAPRAAGARGPARRQSSATIPRPTPGILTSRDAGAPPRA